MAITCVIRYEIDPFQREAFNSLAAYERYRARLKSDAEARDNFNMAQTKRLILREERNFVEVVEGTLGVPPASGSKL